MKQFANKICNKLKIRSIGTDYYEVDGLKWAHIGAKLYFGSNETFITNIENNKIYVNAIIPTPNDYIRIESINIIYENMRLIDVLNSLSFDGYLPFIIDNILTSDADFNDEAQLTVAIPYPEYSLHTQALNAARYYANAIIDCYRRYSPINILRINTVSNFHNIAAGLDDQISVKFNHLYAAAVIEYTKTYATLSN